MYKIFLKNIKHPFSTKEQLIGAIIEGKDRIPCLVADIEDVEASIKPLMRINVLELLDLEERAFIDKLLNKYDATIKLEKDPDIDLDQDFYVVGRPYGVG